MGDFIEVLVKVIPIIAGIFAVIRFIVTTTNKSIIEIIITPKNIRLWEDFFELVVLSLIITTGLIVPSLVLGSISESVINIIGSMLLVVLLVTSLLIIAAWVSTWFTKFKWTKKLSEIGIIGNFLTVILIMFLISFELSNDLKQLISDEEYLEIVLIYLSCDLLIFILFKIYRTLFRHLYKPRQGIYQIKRVETNKINEELESLIFRFAIDNERYILNHLPPSRDMQFPIYVYFPKENNLIKYVKINQLTNGEK